MQCQRLTCPSLGLEPDPQPLGAWQPAPHVLGRRSSPGSSTDEPALVQRAVTPVCDASRRPSWPHAGDRAAARGPSAGITFRAAGGHSAHPAWAAATNCHFSGRQRGIFPSPGFTGPSNASHSRSRVRVEAPVVSN